MAKEISQDIKKVLFSEEEIQERCKELAQQIEQDYLKDGVTPLVVGLLKGSVPFMSELIKYFKQPIEIDFMSVSSYTGDRSSGHVKIDKDLDLDSIGKNILIVEDIIDTGRTIKEVKRFMKERGAKDVKVVSLLNKPERREVDIEADYIGYTIPNEFVVGYGLDYNQLYRNLPYIGVIDPSKL